MAQVTITIPDAQVNRVRDAMRAVTGNPGFGADDFVGYIGAHLKSIVKQVEADAAIATAREDAEDDVDSTLTIT